MGTSASSVYGDFLKDELDRQDARKASFEQRGLAVVTTAGTLVTLLAGVAALSATTTSQLGKEETVWLGVGLVLFVACSFAGLFVNVPTAFGAVRAPSVAKLLDAVPENKTEDAQYAVAGARLKILQTAQKKNSRKGNLLFLAITLEMLAVVCVGVAVFEVVVTSPKTAPKYEKTQSSKTHEEHTHHRHHHHWPGLD